ncbi:hypothetical protein GOB94_13185 [Granulicella sp. 5B5]|uniref:hypothetical protein n=1 Tax=Granulicella sp. 5B5 TaxID=1617967 RepID=UPI0015F3D239|nr:hypothetical protein [Granulicella sp. 5B5]QMV19531.1 hypothetical protein GOB94_13185 [Granulicella sp. 5B5]
MKEATKKTARKKNALLWLFEPLLDDPRFVQRKLFSFDAAYLDGKLYVAVNDGEEPWSGLLVCTSREHHAALLAEFPQLTPHEVLGKWLYLSQAHPEFESVATDIVALVVRRDRRLGVVSSLPQVRR